MLEIFVWQNGGKIPINFTRARNSSHMQENMKFFIQNEETVALLWHTVHIVITTLLSCFFFQEGARGWNHIQLAFMYAIASRWIIVVAAYDEVGVKCFFQYANMQVWKEMTDKK